MTGDRSVRALVGLLTLVGLSLGAASQPIAAGATPGRIAATDLTLAVDDDGAGADDDPGDGTCATAGGDCTLLAALQEAGETAGTGVVAITVPAGTFPLARTVAIDRDVTLTGAGRGTTTVEVDGGPGITVSDAALTIARLELTGGLTTAGVGGSAITGDGADVTFTDARIADNHADGDGGAVQLFAGSLTMTGTDVRANSGQTGGAVHVALSAVLIDDSTFGANSASASGGAIHLSYPRAFSITDTSFTDNTAVGQGGAVSVVGFSGPAGGTATIARSTFDGNLASADGGAVFAGRLASGQVEVPLRLDGSTFTGNSAQVGGAVALDLGLLGVTNSTFEKNRAAAGAGGAIASGGSITVQTSTFTKNSASEAGGAISANGPTTITGSTFTENRAGTLGGALDLFARTTPVVTGSTFTDNVADVGGGAIWRLGDDLTESGNTYSGNLPAGDPIVIGPAPVSDRQVPSTTTTTVVTTTTPGGTTTTPGGTTTRPGETTTTGSTGGAGAAPNGSDVGGGSNPDAGGDSSLVRTGAMLIPLVLVALALIGAGFTLRATRRRQST